MLKNKKFLNLICGVMSVCTLFSTSIFAADSNTSSVNSSEITKSSTPYVIVVEGKDNAEEYIKAGIIKKSSGNIKGTDILTSSSGIGILSSSKPSAVWNINYGERAFTYGPMTSYTYSNYAYIPNEEYNEIWHEITPNSNQNLKIDCYSSSNNDSLWATILDDYIDELTYVGVYTPTGIYYFKYINQGSTAISGSGIVY